MGELNGASETTAERLAGELLRFDRGNRDVTLPLDDTVASLENLIAAVMPHVQETQSLTQDGATRQLYLRMVIERANQCMELLTSAEVSAAGAAMVSRKMQPRVQRVERPKLVRSTKD